MMNPCTLLNATNLVVGLFCGMLIGFGIACMAYQAKRQSRIMTARHLRRKEYGNRWSQSHPVHDPLEIPPPPDWMKQAGARGTQIGGDHYRSKKIQPWDAMEVWLTPEQFKGFLRGNVIKYMARCDDKGGLEDIKKADHYLTKLLEREG